MLSKKLTLKDLTKEQLQGKRVLMRVDYNVPFGKDGAISNDTRIAETLPTIAEIFEKGAHSLVLLSHLGRPDGNIVPKYTLKPVAERLQKLLGKEVTFVADCVGPEARAACEKPKQGAVILLENLRFHPEEEGAQIVGEKKIKADPEAVKAFRKELSTFGDVFVNDAFGTAHRAHSSMVGIDLPLRAAGNLVKRELDAFIPVLESPKKPFLSILGGAKVADKIKLIMNLLEKVDEMIICGGMAYTFIKAMRPEFTYGDSIFSQEDLKTIPDILKKAEQKGVKMTFPVDFKIGDKFAADCNTKFATVEEGIPDGWAGFDIGPKSIELFHGVILRANTIIWNGPAGVYEFEAFQAGTRGMLEAAAEDFKRGAVVVIGGGDAGTCAINWGYKDKITHVSTGGGASLELLEGAPMPGLAALSDK